MDVIPIVCNTIPVVERQRWGETTAASIRERLGRASAVMRERPRQFAVLAVVLVVALIASVFVLVQPWRSDEQAGPWRTPLWSNWPAASIDNACTVGVCVGDTVALPLGRPVEAVVDLQMPEELGALTIERAWTGEPTGERTPLFGAGWETVWDVRLVDDMFTGPLPAEPAEAPRRGHLVALEGGASVHVDDEGRLDQVCLDTSVCTEAEWSDDSLVLRPVLGESSEAGSRPTVTLSLEEDRVVGAKAADGRTVEYRYATGRLTSVAQGENETAYGYESGRLVSIDDGVRRTYTYDRSGQVVAATDLNGGRWTIGPPGGQGPAAERTGSGRQTFEVQSPDGWTRTYRFRGGLLVEAVDDELGVLLRREIDGNKVAVEERPLEGLRSERIAADQLQVVQQSEEGPDRTTRYWFDEDGRVARAETPEGTTRVRYDGRSQRPAETRGPNGTQTFDYDRHGLLEATEDADGYRVEIERNNLGQPVVLTDGVQRTEFDYDAAGRATEERTGDAKTSASYRSDGLVAALTTTDGDQLDASYDEVRQLRALGDTNVEPAAPADPAAADAGDSMDDVVKTVERSDGGYEQRYPSGETVILDEAGRPVKVTVDGRTESRRYDDSGRLVELDLPGGPTYELTYTKAGRVASVTDGTETTELTWHGDLLLSAETSAGSSYEYDYDEAGRVASASSGPLRWDYTYDAAGRSSVVRGPSGVVRTRWDDQGRPIEVRDGGHLERYRWKGDGLALAQVDIDDEEVLGFQHDDTGKVIEVSQPESGTAELGYDPETGELTSYRIGDADELKLDYDRQGRVTSIEAGDRTENWTWDSGEVVKVEVDGEDDPYRLEWLAPGLLGRVEHADDVLIRTKVDDAGRPTKVWKGDDVAATLKWDATGLVEASLEDGPSATVQRDDEHRIIRVELDERRAGWEYEDGALTGMDDGERATSFEYEDGRLKRTTVEGGDDKSTITWDPARSRPASIDTPEGKATFAYGDGKVQAIQVDDEDQEARYEDDEPTADGEGGELLDALFDETGRYRSPLGRSTEGPSTPWIDSLPGELGVTLPAVVTGRAIAETAIDDQLPNVPTFLIDDPDNLAEQTAQGLVATSVAIPVLGGPDQVAALGLEVDGDNLEFGPTGSIDALAVGQAVEILGPGPGLVERVVDFGQRLVGAVGGGLQAIQGFLRDDPRGRFLLDIAYMVGERHIPTLCKAVGVATGLLVAAITAPTGPGAVAWGGFAGTAAYAGCPLVAEAGLRAVDALVTAEPGQSLASTMIAAAVRPYAEFVRSVRSLDAVGAYMAASELAPGPGPSTRTIRRLRAQVLPVACGLRRVACISQGRFGAAAQHVADAQRGGAPRLLRLDRSGALARRSSALRSLPSRAGFDRDEYPFALSSRRNALSIQYVDPASNRSLGAYVGNQLSALPDGSWFYVLPIA